MPTQEQAVAGRQGASGAWDDGPELELSILAQSPSEVSSQPKSWHDRCVHSCEALYDVPIPNSFAQHSDNPAQVDPVPAGWLPYSGWLPGYLRLHLPLSAARARTGPAATDADTR